MRALQAWQLGNSPLGRYGDRSRGAQPAPDLVNGFGADPPPQSAPAHGNAGAAPAPPAPERAQAPGAAGPKRASMYWNVSSTAFRSASLTCSRRSASSALASTCAGGGPDTVALARRCVQSSVWHATLHTRPPCSSHPCLKPVWLNP